MLSLLRPTSMHPQSCCVLGAALVSLVLASGCGDDADSAAEETAGEDGERARHGLSGEEAAEVLVKVGDREITAGEFADRLSDQSPYLRARYNSPERRREFLENMIRFELLAQEGERRGLDERPEVQRTVKQMMIQQMMRERFEERIRLADISDAEVEAHYRAHESDFHQPEQVRASHILVRDEATARRLLTELLAAPGDVALFRRLAETHNVDPETRGPRRGDLRFFSRDGTRNDAAPREEGPEGVVDPRLAEAAFAIESVGGYHPEPIRTDAGYHILKLTGRHAALRRSLDEARRTIQNRLWHQKREDAVEAFVAELRRDAEIEENLDALAAVRVDPTPPSAPDEPQSAGDETPEPSP